MQDELTSRTQDLEEGLKEWDFQELYNRIKSVEDRKKSPGPDAFNTVTLADIRYGLGLDNHSLDVSIAGRDINIHYWQDEPHVGRGPFKVQYEVNIRIGPDDVATRVMRELATGRDTTEAYSPVK